MHRRSSAARCARKDRAPQPGVSAGAGRVGIGLRQQRRDNVGSATAQVKVPLGPGQHPPARDQRPSSATRCVSVPRAHSTCARPTPGRGLCTCNSAAPPLPLHRAPVGARIPSTAPAAASRRRGQSAPAPATTGTPPDAPAARSQPAGRRRADAARRSPPPPARRRNAASSASQSGRTGSGRHALRAPDAGQAADREGFEQLPGIMPKGAFSTGFGGARQRPASRHRQTSAVAAQPSRPSSRGPAARRARPGARRARAPSRPARARPAAAASAAPAAADCALAHTDQSSGARERASRGRTGEQARTDSSRRLCSSSRRWRPSSSPARISSMPPSDHSCGRARVPLAARAGWAPPAAAGAAA